MIMIMLERFETTFSGPDVRRRHFAAGALLFRRDEPVHWLHVVVTGRVHLVRQTRQGSNLILQRAQAGALLAEASLFSGSYHCDGRAEEPTETLGIRVAAVRKRLLEEPEFARWWSSHLAREVQAARLRAELLTLKTVAERLDAWLDLNGGAVPPRGARRRLAAELGMSPEALYREINRRVRSLPPRVEGSDL
jgi:CRP-like cAMP-binding protein